MPQRPATWMTRVRSTAPSTSVPAPVESQPLRCVTSASATRPFGSSSTRCHRNTATVCFSAPVPPGITRLAPSADVRPSCQSAPTRTKKNPTVSPYKPPARPTTYAGMIKDSLSYVSQSKEESAGIFTKLFSEFIIYPVGWMCLRRDDCWTVTRVLSLFNEEMWHVDSCSYLLNFFQISFSWLPHQLSTWGALDFWVSEGKLCQLSAGIFRSYWWVNSCQKIVLAVQYYIGYL